MLTQSELNAMLQIMQAAESGEDAKFCKWSRRDLASKIHQRLRPHPAGQKEENVPRINGLPIEGMQHKYRETVLFFPSEVCLEIFKV